MTKIIQEIYPLPVAHQDRRLAVLIDAENVSPKITERLFEEIARMGKVCVRRIYGDFSNAQSNGWADVLAEHAIIPQQQFAYTKGKNASDITLVIDAMDLVYSGLYDGFCLVSSDSDFTRLATRIREQGMDVFGFGEKKTPLSLRRACHRFIYTENLLPDASKSAINPSKVVPLIKTAIRQVETEDGWAWLGPVGQQIRNLESDFDSRTYGFNKLGDLVRKTGVFEITDPKNGPLRIRVKLKPSEKQKRS